MKVYLLFKSHCLFYHIKTLKNSTMNNFAPYHNYGHDLIEAEVLPKNIAIFSKAGIRREYLKSN